MYKSKPRGVNASLMIRAMVLIILPLLGMQSASAGCLIPNFNPTSVSLSSPRAQVVNDFNKDGKPDLAVANTFGSTISILLGNGNGFSAPTNIHGGRTPTFIASGDLNGDGNPDLVVANQVTVEGELHLFFGNGNGTFAPFVGISLGGPNIPGAVAIADVNGDGKMDLITSYTNSNSVAIRLGNGSGGFTFLKGFDSGGFGPSFLAATDINGDGKMDLAILNASSLPGNVAIFLNDGATNFSLVGPFLVGSLPNSLTFGDFNGDSKLDLGIVNKGDNNVAILLGNGNGSFRAATNYQSLGKRPEAVVNADFNGDGKLDLAVSNAGLGSIVFFSGDGFGGFSPVANFKNGVPSFDVNGESMAVTDINNDGQPDLVSLNELGRAAFSLVNSCGINPEPRVEFVTNGFVGYEGPNGTGSGAAVPVVIRTGDITSAAGVDYATSDEAGSVPCSVVQGKASSRCDYLTTSGTLHFGATEISKSFSIPITDDSYAEGDEAFNVAISNPVGGSLGTTNSVFVGINDNDASNGSNPIGTATFFVGQHYVDFLNREADASGLSFWTDQINSCGSDQACIEVKRINVSAAFFLSIEFQETGYLVERLYKASYGDATGTSSLGQTHQLSVPTVRLNEFLPDTQEIGRGLVVGQTGWEQVLENNKIAFILQFVQRSRFTTAYPTTLTPAQFVDALFANAGVIPPASERTSIINEFGAAGNTADNAARGRALRRVAENSTLNVNEKNRAFVLMQFFGYLRRNPNDPQDTDYTGYDYWLSKLNQFNGNFVNAEMVKAFIDSTEYRARFGP